MRYFILKVIHKIIISLYEYTPPHTKYSELNYRVAKVQLSIEKLIEYYGEKNSTHTSVFRKR